MTVSIQSNPKTYEGTGADTALPTTFLFFTSSDIIVWQRVVLTGAVVQLVEDTHYSVTGGSATGALGTVTPIDGATDFTTAMEWTLERSLPLTQTVDYIENDDFPAVSHEFGLDKQTLLSQDTDLTTSRSLRFPVTDLPSLTSELPNSIDRAGKVLTFDATGAVSLGTPSNVTFDRVLLAEETDGLPLSAITLTAEDWPNLYDRVVIEVIRLSPSAATATLVIQPILNGVAIATSMKSQVRSMLNAVTSFTHAADWDTRVATNSGVDAFSGVLDFREYTGFLSGHGFFTYGNAGADGSFDIWMRRTVASLTGWDGFEFSMDTGLIFGVVKLWGIPRE